MAKDFERMEDSNRSTNPSIHEVSDPARRVAKPPASHSPPTGGHTRPPSRYAGRTAG